MLRSLLLLLLGFATPAWAHEGFTGTWVLDKQASDSLDPLLQAQGVGWFKRKAAAGLDVTQVIEVEGDTVHIEVQSSLKSGAETVQLDGVARERVGEQGPARVAHRWEAETWVTTSQASSPAGEPLRTTLTRSLSDEGQTMTQRIQVEIGGQTLSLDRVFRRQ